MSGPFSHYRITAVTIWLLAVASSWTWNTVDNIREKNSIAIVTARAFYGQILASRQWNLMHGGVYVYSTALSPPNQFLPKDKQFILDEKGKRLTLMNPSYMTRQIAEISRQKGLVRFHITSLTPLRPENKPYPWEVPWLEAFARGSHESSSFADEDGKEIFHYMAPLPLQESCKPCHSAATTAGSNIRGAISVSLPIPFHKSVWPLFFSHIFVALTGIVGILFFGGRLAQSRKNILKSNTRLEQEVEERKETEKELISIKENLEQIVDSRTRELRRSNEALDAEIEEQQRIEAALVSINDEFIQIFNTAPDGMLVIDLDFNIIRVNHAQCLLTGKDIKDIQGHKCYEALPGKLCHTDQCPLKQIRNGTKRVEIEIHCIHTDGTEIPCMVTATPFKEPGGALTGMIQVTRDVSD